ncbi:MAG: MFS transporter, partial [Thermoplasmata archaeon]
KSLADLVHFHRGVNERVRQIRTRVVGVIDLTRSSAEKLPGKEYLFLAALGVMSVGFDIFYGPFPVFLWQDAKFTDAGVFIVYLGAAAASTALFFHSGRAVDSHSPKAVFLESLSGRVLLMLLFLWGPIYILFGLGSPALLAWLTLLNALLGVSWAFISTASTLFLVRLVGRSARGRALGLYSALAGAGGLVGTLLGGWLYATYGVHFAYSIAAFTVVLGGLLLLPIPYHVFQVPHRMVHRNPLARSVRATVPPPPKPPRRFG